MSINDTVHGDHGVFTDYISIVFRIRYLRPHDGARGCAATAKLSASRQRQAPHVNTSKNPSPISEQILTLTRTLI